VRAVIGCAPLLLAAAARLPAQQPFVFHGAESAAATAVGVLWQYGFDDGDDARVLVECRLERARAHAPEPIAAGALVGDTWSLVFVVGRTGRAEDLAAFVGALLDDGLALTDDTILLAIGRAALSADDAEHLYPGLVLASGARRALFAGTPAARAAAGSARVIAGTTVADVRQRLRRPPATFGVGCGPAADGDVIVRLPWRPGAAVRAPVVPAAAATALERVVATHARVDGPFAAVAFRAPAAGDLPAFAVAMEIASARAAGRFPAHGSEARARAPFVGWSWLRGDPFVLFCRRGPNFRRILPGERVDLDPLPAAEATAAELRGFLVDLVAVPPDRAEVAAARDTVSGLCTPGFGPEAAWLGDAATMPGPIQAALLATHHGIDATALRSVDDRAVARVLAELLAPERGHWQLLLPERMPGRGFPLR
jgi:hypothetical protein